MSKNWQQGSLVELEITDLSSTGDGVGKFEGRVVFVPDTVTGDRAKVRLTQVKSKYARGKVQQLLIPSIYRIRPRCIVADKCGGCQWQHVNYEHQCVAKRQQVIQALQRLGGFTEIKVEPILYTRDPLNYRNKSTYPLARSTTGQVQAGYYRQGSHQLINLNQCPVQDERLNPLLAEVKQDIQQRGWSIYSEKRHQGKLRHLSLRIGKRTGEMLLTLVTTNWQLEGIEAQAQTWLQTYPQLVGVCLNLNQAKTNVIFGRETRTIAGKGYVREKFAGIELHIRTDTFFQVNTEAAELLLTKIEDTLDLQGQEIIVDAYCGIGTFTLPLARKVQQVIGIELQSSSIEQAQRNAEINNINNVTFIAGAVEKYLQQLEVTPDIILLDPPRKGCDRTVIDTLIALKPDRIVYISCKPATLARDLKLLCRSRNYYISLVQPVDFFPQTTHVECCVLLNRLE
ncbi:MAG: 23S rRNA (uracil(1939)-C(5))-methyltransferase RlmD [Xenococcaceae cyanobacterium MO_188.B32]|nr:23S rRNA (uracil(1939)-C(5))-methyltransferase RlmD [Xenococcaceae cyanobacterium MO_188.B32]